MYKLTEDEQKDGINNICATTVAAKMSTTKKSPSIIGFTKDNPGNSGATVSTIDRYKDIWRGIQKFCIGIGDYKLNLKIIFIMVSLLTTEQGTSQPI